MRKFNTQVLKIAITEEKLKMEISLKDLKRLFETNDKNTYNGIDTGVTVKENMIKEYAAYIARFLLDDEYQDNSMPNWLVPFQKVFDEIVEGYEDFAEYHNEDQGRKLLTVTKTDIEKGKKTATKQGVKMIINNSIILTQTEVGIIGSYLSIIMYLTKQTEETTIKITGSEIELCNDKLHFIKGGGCDQIAIEHKAERPEEIKNNCNEIYNIITRKITVKG